MVYTQDQTKKAQLDFIDASLLRSIHQYTLAPFQRNLGYRRSVIYYDLFKAGVKPEIDKFGNIWVKKGNGNNTVVVSSHMDTVFGYEEKNYYIESRNGPDGMEIMGNLDNSVGCSINAVAAKNLNPSCSTYFIFTFGEEPPCGNEGAEDVVKILKEKNIDPKLCVVLDLTYPANLRSHSYAWSVGAVSALEELDEELCSIDQTPSYAENFSDVTLFNLLKTYLEKSPLKGKVVARHVQIPDESSAYSRHFSTFSLCPVAYNHMHSFDCVTYLENVRSSYDFLTRLLAYPNLIESMPLVRRFTYSSEDKDYTGRVWISDKELRDFDNNAHIGIERVLRKQVKELFNENISEKGVRENSDDLLWDYISESAKKLRLNDFVRSDFQIPKSTLIAYSVSDDIENHDGYLHCVDDYISFMIERKEVEKNKYLSKIIEEMLKNDYFKVRSSVNFAPEKRKPKKFDVFVPSQKGLELTTVSILGKTTDLLLENIYPQYQKDIQQCRRAANSVLNLIKCVELRYTGPNRIQIIKNLHEAHEYFYQAEFSLNHQSSPADKKECMYYAWSIITQEPTPCLFSPQFQDKEILKELNTISSVVQEG